MPFTIGGERIPPAESSKPKKTVKVVLEKRKNSLLTVIHHLPLNEEEMLKLCSELKKKFGSGGAVKEEKIEIQGDKVELVLKFLEEKRLKSPSTR